MLSFDHIIFLSLLILVPELIIVYWLVNRRRKKLIQKFGNPELMQRMIGDYSKWRPRLKFWLLMAAVVFLVLAVVNFKIGSKLGNTKHKGIDVMIALDISNSMRAQDIKPDRLERAKMAISKLIDKLEDDQIGIVVFAGRAQTLLPITTDYAAAKMLTSNVNPGYIQVQGTAIGQAIQLCTSSFDKNSKNKKAIIVLTDGENHEDDAVEAAKMATKEDIRVFTIGMGSEYGAPIPMGGELTSITYKKDKDGNTVVTKLDESLLKQIAAAANGTYTRASTSDVGLNDVLKEINKIEKKEFEARTYIDYHHSFPLFAGLALLMLVLEFFIFERKTRFTRNINVFGKKHIVK